MGSWGPKVDEDAVMEGIERGYREHLELVREGYADLEDTLKTLKRYAAAARERLVDNGSAYIGNNLVTLAESAYDQLKRVEVVQGDYDG